MDLLLLAFILGFTIAATIASVVSVVEGRRLGNRIEKLERVGIVMAPVIERMTPQGVVSDEQPLKKMPMRMSRLQTRSYLERVQMHKTQDVV